MKSSVNEDQYTYVLSHTIIIFFQFYIYLYYRETIYFMFALAEYFFPPLS